MNSVRFQWLFILILLVLPVFSSQDPGNLSYLKNMFTTSTASLSSIVPAAIAAMMIGLLLAGISYALGKAFGLSSLLAWAKEEFYENMYSGVIIVFIGFLVFVGDVIAVMGNPQDPDNLLMDAYNRMDAILTGEDDTPLGEVTGLDTVLISTYLTQISLSSISNFAGSIVDSLGVSISPKMPSKGGSMIQGMGIGHAGSVRVSSSSLLAGLEGSASILSEINMLVFTALIFVMVHKAILVFAMGAGPVLLAIGIFFRGLSFTRRLGSTLIAMFITLTIVYPATLILFASDEFYGKIVDDFPMQYSKQDWITKIGELQQPYVILNYPRDAVLYKEGENYFIRFRSVVPDFSYEIKTYDGRVVCQGTGNNLEYVECDITDIVGSASKIELNSKKQISFSYDDFLKFIIKIKWKGYKLSNGLSISSINSQDKVSFEDHDYSFWVSFPVLVTQCTLDDDGDSQSIQIQRCNSNYLSINSQFRPIVDEVMYASALSDDPDDVWNIDLQSAVASSDTGGTMEGVADLAMRAGTSYALKKMIRVQSMKAVGKAVAEQAAKKAGEKAAETAISKGMGALGGGPLSVVTTVLSFKQLIISGVFNIITCDPFTASVGMGQINENIYKDPEASTNWISFKDAVVSLGSGIGSVTDDMIYAWGESDYSSCMVVEYSKNLLGKIPGLKDYMTTLSLPLMYTRLTAVYLMTILTLVVSVTTFRSISEVLGGDSSLVGLGKISLR